MMKMHYSQDWVLRNWGPGVGGNMSDSFTVWTWPERDLSHLKSGGTNDATSKITSDGGPASYYDFPAAWQTLNDYIEHKSGSQWGADSFHLANITKAACRWGDKEGTTKAYDARKIVYSALRILRRICGPEAVQEYLKELQADKQFQRPE